MMYQKLQRLTKLFVLTLLLVPMHAFAYSDYIVAGGTNIGIKVNSDKVMIVGLYQVNDISPGKDAGLVVGDKINTINKKVVANIDDMVSIINEGKEVGSVQIEYVRAGKTLETELKLVKQDDDVYKTGLYVKDSISGIGTLTFIDPGSKLYGALGHEIVEGATGQKIEVKDGHIFRSSVTGIDKSTRGEPGEKNAKFYSDSIYGTVNENTINGIFGQYTDEIKQDHLYKVAKPSEITTGEASIFTVVEGEKVEEFKINIIKLASNEDQKVKNILFEITDQRLLDKTGGIVQGMSGSPIIQHDKIIGAVTHVVVNQTTQGYGVFITNMLEEADKQ